MEIIAKIYQWVIEKPLIIGASGSLLATAFIAVVFKLPARILKWLRLRRRVTFSKSFPFERVNPETFGQRLLGERKLTCYENLFVPKEEEVIHTSGNPYPRRKIFLGAAETGKTRAAVSQVAEAR